jgi:hypothetical protein
MSRLRICKRCGGSGSLLKPQKGKFLTFKRCTTCGGKGLKGRLTMPRTLEDLLADMRKQGKAFGRRVRDKEGAYPVPEPLFLGKGTGSYLYRIGGTDAFRIATMQRLKLKNEFGYYWTWAEFFDRK